MKPARINPQKVIIGHYDDLINCLDLHTEILLQKIDEQATVQVPQLVDTTSAIFPSRYKDDFEFSELIGEPATCPDGLVNARDFIQLVRDKALHAIREAQEENLAQLKSNGGVSVSCNFDETDCEAMEKLRRELFGNKFCFFLMDEFVCGQKKSEKSVFKMSTVVVDFYMSLDDIQLLEEIVTSKPNESHVCKLNDKHLIVVLLASYLKARNSKLPKLGYEVIKVGQKTLLSIKEVSNIDLLTKISTINLTGTEFDLSGIMSLAIHGDLLESDGLSGLATLEYLCLQNALVPPEALQPLMVLELLKLDNCEFPEDFKFPQLAHLRRLEICGGKSYHLDLSSLESLAHLEINQLSRDSLVSVGTLKSLGFQITTLKFISSCISNRKADVMFKGLRLPNLIELDLTDNEIRSIKPEWFTSMSKLEMLNLTNNYVHRLAKSDLETLVNLKVLSLRENTLASLDHGVLGELVNLQSLDLSFLECLRNAELLSAGLFAGLRNLTELNLHGNWIRSIDPKVFVQIPSLRKLVLTKNKLVLKANTFASASELLDLNLGSGLDWRGGLQKCSFVGLDKLEKLDLSGNMLKNLDPEWFNGLENLKVLDVTFNNCSAFKLDLDKLLPKTRVLMNSGLTYY